MMPKILTANEKQHSSKATHEINREGRREIAISLEEKKPLV